MAEQQPLTNDHGPHREVHRVADAAVCTADDEPLGWGDGSRRSYPLHGEADEGRQEEGIPAAITTPPTNRTGNDQSCADQPVSSHGIKPATTPGD